MPALHFEPQLRPNPRLMGRPKLYHTDEERAAAARGRSHRYYHSKPEAIREARRTKRIVEKDKEEPSHSVPRKRYKTLLTEEERILKNRLKSKRYYERNKSEIKARRQARSSTRAHSGTPGQKKAVPLDVWRQRTADLATRFQSALTKGTAKSHLKNLCREFVRSGSAEVLAAAHGPFNAILKDIEKLESEILNRLGCGAHLAETHALSLEVKQVVSLQEDLEIVAIGEGRATLVYKYRCKALRFQQRL